MPQCMHTDVGYNLPQNNDTKYRLARALYDNKADSGDELSFSKGDVVVVLQQNPGNITGWWLCTSRGRKGLCPGNRLKLMDCGPDKNMDASNSNLGETNRKSWPINSKNASNGCYDTPPTAHSTPTATPTLPSDDDSYDIPRALLTAGCCSPASSTTTPGGATSRLWSPTVDHSRTVSPGGGGFRRSLVITEDATYDIPRPLAPTLQSSVTITGGRSSPSSSVSSLTMDSINSSSNRSSLTGGLADYDVPRPFAGSIRGGRPSPVQQPQQQVYDVPTSQAVIRELPLELTPALETLKQLETESTVSITKLLDLVKPYPHTNTPTTTTPTSSTRLAIVRFRGALHAFTEFTQAVLGNAARASDKNLAGKLVPLVNVLRNSDVLVGELSEKVLGVMVEEDGGVGGGGEDLDTLMSCALAVTEEIKQVAGFVQGNSTLLFKRDSSGVDEADNYVNFKTKQKNSDLSINEHQDSVATPTGTIDYDGNLTSALTEDDRAVLLFFARQAVKCNEQLSHAIDDLLKCVEQSQPPKLFLAHEKFVVLSAHKLVHIADSVHRNVVKNDVKVAALECANALAQGLATNVSKTRRAAVHFPSVQAVQEMVNSAADVAYLARGVKFTLLQAAQP